MEEKSQKASNELVSLARMARQLGVSRAWLKLQAIDRKVPGLLAGAKWLFVPDAVTATLAEMAREVAHADAK